MKAEFTLPEINHLICAADGIEDAVVRDARYQKLRVLYQKGFLIPTNEVSRGKVAKYSLANVCEASIALELSRKGMTDNLLRQVLDDLRKGDSPHRHELPKGMHNPKVWSFENVISSIWEHGQIWLLTICTFDQSDDSVAAWSFLHPTSDGNSEADVRLRGRVIHPEQFAGKQNLGKTGLKYIIDLRHHTLALMNEIARQYGD